MKDALGHGSNSRGNSALPPLQRRHLIPSAHAPLGPQLRAKSTADKAMAAIDQGKAPAQLQRRHYENIAATLAEQGRTSDAGSHSARVSHYADKLASTNPQFNRARFVAAATRH